MTKPRRQYGHIMRMVELEYGQPFWDVVAGFGADGESINATALILGYTDGQGLRGLVIKHGMQHLFPKRAHDTNGWINGVKNQRKTKAKAASSRENIRKANAAYIAKRRFEHNGFIGTFGEHCDRAGINRSTARGRVLRGETREQALQGGRR